MTSIGFREFILDPEPLSQESFERAVRVLVEFVDDFPVVIGSAISAGDDGFLTWLTKQYPALAWLAIPTQILKSPDAWYVWGSKAIVISEGSCSSISLLPTPTPSNQSN